MMSRRLVLSAVLTILAFAAVSFADQPFMNAARTDLQQAKAQLNSATHNKGGHRTKAIGYVNSAIAEVNAGARFDRRHNHVQLPLSKVSFVGTAPDQPHMQRALENLRQAKSNLERANNDKGGHRVKAIGYVNSAIDEVKKGIDAGE